MDASGFALVVGAGSGIGLETAFTFAERGARGVVFADKNLDAVKDAVEKSKALATAQGYEAVAIEVDVASRQAVRAMIAETVSKFGRIDYAVNCAGVPRMKEATLGQVSDEEFELLHDVNCRGVLHCLQEEIEVMKSQEERFVEGRSGRRGVGRGSITVITSLSAVLGAPKTATYVASKFAARGIVKVAGEYSRHNCIEKLY
nr:3-oxoacyl-[acyl-carrier-protein] reductase fabg [Quercus suber]